MGMKYKRLHWTEHAKLKMRQYRLSKQKLMQLLYRPERREQGIALGTTAVMRSNKGYQKPTMAKAGRGEIWLMYKDAQGMRKIISAWRYPGVSKPGGEIPMPEDIKRELLNA